MKFIFVMAIIIGVTAVVAYFGTQEIQREAHLAECSRLSQVYQPNACGAWQNAREFDQCYVKNTRALYETEKCLVDYQTRYVPESEWDDRLFLRLELNEDTLEQRDPNFQKND